MRYTFLKISDSGHGWLAVDRLHLRALGIEGEISGYSYADGAIVYLEEDCDAEKFLNALEANGDTYFINHQYGESESAIRGFKRYNAKAGY